jgi:DNA-binding NarL/FixJ family response regulator
VTDALVPGGSAVGQEASRCSAYTNREIAAALVISVKTASVHVSHILRKLDAPNRLEAAAIAHRLALPRGG